eukprot:jgi/Botrbrau1/12474/Bobra.0169s0021.1
MPPKKAKEKTSTLDNSEDVEPEHHPSWETAFQSGVWERPPDALPDVTIWPSWGVLRERILLACRQIAITGSPGVRDAFIREIINLSPSGLQELVLSQCHNLTQAVVAPATSCVKLEVLDLSCCSRLSYTHVLSNSLRTLCLHNCPALRKVIVQAHVLESLDLRNCPALETVIIWGDSLKELQIPDTPVLKRLFLSCPALLVRNVPPVRPPETSQQRRHPPISVILREEYKEAAAKAMPKYGIGFPQGWTPA